MYNVRNKSWTGVYIWYHKWCIGTDSDYPFDIFKLTFYNNSWMFLGHRTQFKKIEKHSKKSGIQYIWIMLFKK